MTEEEAKSKWCPFVRVPVGSDPIEGNHASNRWTGGGYDQQHCCIGSACMAWRWDMDWESSTEEGHGGDMLLRLKRRNGEPKAGFCGLAGTAL